MRLYAANGARGTVTDLDTGLAVPHVIWLDVEAGELQAYEVDLHGNPVKDARGDYLWYKAHGRFSFTPGQQGAITSAPQLGADRCGKCRNPLTLPGDDLCAACRAKERGQRHQMRVEELTTPFLDVKCCECTETARYCVSDEVEVSPQAGPFNLLGGRTVLFGRAATVGRRYYCSWHFKPPRLLDARGEVIGDIEDSLRPQHG